MIASLLSRVPFALFGAVLLATPLSAQAAAPERRVALVIGNSHYQHAPALANPAPDAHAISDAFRRLGIDVTEGYNLNERDMRALLVKFANAMAGAKGAIVFYAGHGVALDGVNYMLPIDIDLKSPADLDLNGVSVDLVLRQMRRDDRVNVIILDACRDNPFAAALSRSVVRAAVSSRGLQAIGGDLARGAMIAFSTEPGATAFDGPAGAHSPFTAALLRHIEDPATSIENVMSRVRGEVFAATDSKQLPWVNTSIVGDFELNPRKPEPVAPPPREASATQATENLMWETAERSHATEDYWTYLDAFPNGSFAPFARRRIEAARLTPNVIEDRALSPDDRVLATKLLNLKSSSGLDEVGRARLREWQKGHGYASTGYLDSEQLARLKSEAALHSTPAPAPPKAQTPARSTPPKPPVRATAALSKPAVVMPPPKPIRQRLRSSLAQTNAQYEPETAPSRAPAYGLNLNPTYRAGGGGGGGAGGGGAGGGGAGGGGGGWSDHRLKRDVCRVGASASGIPMYTFRYLWSDDYYAGAMAQDLLSMRPEAVRKLGEYYWVDYGLLDVAFARIDKPATCGIR